MKLLLVPQQQITTSEASCAFWTLKGLFLGMRALMALKMLQARKRSLASVADVWTRLIGFGGWARCWSFRIYGYSGGYREEVSLGCDRLVVWPRSSPLRLCVWALGNVTH